MEYVISGIGLAVLGGYIAYRVYLASKKEPSKGGGGSRDRNDQVQK